MSGEPRVRVAVLGAGHWGPNLITNFHRNSRSRVVWVADRDSDRLAELDRRFEGLRLTRDSDAVLADAEVDAVVIATPTSTHFDLAKAALEHGKHVLVEKPVADSAERAAELAALSEASGRVLMVGHIFLYNAGARFVKAYFDRGSLGRVYYLSMVRTNLGPIRVDVNAAWDLAAHDISLASYWLDGEPQSVSAQGGSWINPGVEDAVFATFRYPDDVLVNLHVSWLNPLKARDITVVGDKRMLTFDDVATPHPIRIYERQVREDRGHFPYIDTFETFRTVVREGKVTTPEIEQSQPLKNECEHFLDCVIHGEAPRTGGREGLAVVAALEALSDSVAQGGKEVEVRSW